jgi:hypothetical protein
LGTGKIAKEEEVIAFPLRRYYPVQVLRVSSQPPFISFCHPELVEGKHPEECRKAKKNRRPTVTFYRHPRSTATKSTGMKKLLLVLSLFVSLSAMAQTIHDANAEVRNVPGFKGVNVSGAIDLFISQGSAEAVAVSAKETKVRDRIKTEVKDGILYISFDGKGWKDWNMGDQKMKAYVTVKDISRLEASGASDVEVSGTLKADNLKLTLSGASDFEGSIEVKNIQVRGSGASDIRISGSAEVANIEMSGASDFKGYDFKIDNCKAEISGAGDMQIYVNKELEAQASGASSIKYKGDAVVKKSESTGASSIKKKA